MITLFAITDRRHHITSFAIACEFENDGNSPHQTDNNIPKSGDGCVHPDGWQPALNTSYLVHPVVPEAESVIHPQSMGISHEDIPHGLGPQ